MACEDVTEDSFTGPLTTDPDAAWRRFLRYGLAEPLRTAPQQVRELVLHDYRQAVDAEHAAGRPAEHSVLFARCQIRRP